MRGSAGAAVSLRLEGFGKAMGGDGIEDMDCGGYELILRDVVQLVHIISCLSDEHAGGGDPGRSDQRGSRQPAAA